MSEAIINNSSLPPKRKRGRPRKVQETTSSEKVQDPPSTKTGQKRKQVNESTAQKKPRVKKQVAATTTSIKPPAEPKRKRKEPIKLPPEASIYLNDAMRGRVLRAMKQKMFVLSRELVDDSIEKFEVIGSIGNTYTVTIASHISCSCTDYIIRRTHCKHILMVMLKIYRLSLDSNMFQSLSTTREERINARSSGRIVDPSVLVPANVRQRILSVSHENHPEVEPAQDTKRRPLDTSDCPICFEEFEQDKIDTIVFCKVCGNNIHEECFNMWKQSKGRDVSCVYCRAKWVSDATVKKSVHSLDSSHINEGKANFAKELGLSRKRDTSTYKSYRGYNFE